MSTIRLIINADDLGNGAATDRGIFNAFTDGIISSASLLVTGPSWRNAARHATEIGLPVGIHLNLSEGICVGPPIPGLTGANGSFLGKGAARHQLEFGGINARAIADEFIAQIELARADGVAPDHLDTHQHCALFPVVTEALCLTSQAAGIQRLRLPLPQEPASEDPPELRADLSLYRRLAGPLTATLKQAGLITPEGLFGMPLLNRFDHRQLKALLQNLPDGTWELMVHPGFADPTHPFATRARETELIALTDPALRMLLRQRHIELITFAELSCAC